MDPISQQANRLVSKHSHTLRGSYAGPTLSKGMEKKEWAPDCDLSLAGRVMSAVNEIIWHQMEVKVRNAFKLPPPRPWQTTSVVMEASG